MFNTIELVPEKSIALPASLTIDGASEDGDDFGDLLGGVIKNGELGWVANGAHLDIYLMKSKQRISSYTFELSSNLQPSLVSCVTELFIPDINSPILAVCVQFAENNGMICIFSVQGSRVLRSIEFPDKISICCFIPPSVLKYSGIQIFDGCLAVGTDMGKVFLIDLCMKRFNEILHDKMSFRNEIELVPVYNVLVDEGFDSIMLSVKKSRKENCHLSVQLQVLQDSGTVLSMLLLAQQMTLAIGLYDGRMILYDLNNLQAFHLAYPPEMECPLMKLSFIEPIDDPRACIYVWALHYNSKTSIAVMHSIMFEHKQFDPDGFVYFENFQACLPRLTLPLFDECNNRPINCQSIRNRATYEEEEETSCITVISWESFDRNRINFFVFDLNQWYKDQMPEVVSVNRLPNYLALFAVTGVKFGLDLWIYPKSIIPFNSIQRLEEHFYPNSLSFRCIVLSEKRCDHFHWTGVQNSAINYLNAMGSKAIVDPNVCFSMLTSTAIYPQYWEEMYDSRLELTISIKRNFLLSIALEYNCLQLLKECIKLWGDGSHLGDGSEIGVSLSTITDWISQRFSQITNYCKSLCQSFFNNIEQQIDYRLKKQLSYSSKQLKTLEKLLEMIVTVNRTYIPEEIRNKLGAEKDTIKMWYDYYEIILWLSNTDILPEGANVPYPYDILNDYYKTQRYTFRKLDHSTRNYLFIDVFLDTKCNSKELRKLWKSTDGEYPPISLEEMLNILILPNTSNEIKYILILYFFMDLSVALEEDRFCNVIENLIKFPSVFKLKSSIIKRIQAYWKLDHGQHETALDYLFSPLSGEKSFETWETEFLVETLLLQNLPKLALRVLQLNNPSINTLLEIKTLLANNLISDAFKVQRNKNNINLLNYFYKFLFNNCKWELLLDYALNDNEIKVLSNFLNNINSNQSENFHIIFLLQRGKYIDAIKLLNKIKKLNNNANLNMNNTNLILTAYNMTLTPAIKNLTKSYFNFENEFKLHKEKNGTIEQPFSKQLIENPVNSSFNLHKIMFNSIKNCRHGGYDRPQSERIPFLESPYINRSGNGTQLRDRTGTIIPKVINSGDHGKRRSDPEPEDMIEFAQPKKKVMTEADYKIKTLKDFKQTRKYDFSESYSKLMENKQNKMTFNDYSFLTKLSTVEEPATAEQDKSETEVMINMTGEYKTTDDEYFSPEKLKITAEEWNSPLDMSTEILDQRLDEPVELKHHVKFKIVDSLIPEEKVTPEMWNQDEKGSENQEPRIISDFQNVGIDRVIDEKRDQVVHRPFGPMAIPDEKITPEMWNEGADHIKSVDRPIHRMPEKTVTAKIGHVEKSNETSRKPYERPSKRRALRSMSKTPERSFRRSRTKTPEPLTPSRKSKRLLEKTPVTASEPVIEEKPLEIPTIVIEDFSTFKSTTTVEIHQVTETSIVSAITPIPNRQPILDDTEKSELEEPDEDSKPESSNSSDYVVPIKRAAVLRDESDVSQLVEDLTNGSEDLEITYNKKTLFTDSFVEDDVPDVVFGDDDEDLSSSPSSDPSYDDEPVEIDDDDEPGINYDDYIQGVSEEEEIPEEDDDPDRYEVINILSSSSEETSNDSVADEDSNRDEDDDEIVEQFVGDNKTDDEKIIIESQDLPNEHENAENVANIIYENMDIDIGFDEAELAISSLNQEMSTIETVERNTAMTEEVDLNNAILIDSTNPEISTQIQEIETTEIIESNDEPVIDSSKVEEPSEVDESKAFVSDDKLNDAVTITELETIIGDKTQTELNKTPSISTEVDDASLLNQAILTDETMNLTKSTFVAEPEENAMTGDVTESKHDENITGVLNESSFANETKDDSNTLNEALIMVDEEAAEILEMKRATPENDKVPISESAEIDTRVPSAHKTRAASVDPEISTTPKRSTRGSSLPKSIVLPDSIKSPMLRKRRSFSTDSLTPKKSLHITKADMEIIMEGEVLPAGNTPIKAILAEKLRNTPTRRRSTSTEQTGTPTTPGRVTRRSSLSVEAEGTPIKLEESATPTRTGRKRSSSIDVERISSKVSEAGSSKTTRKTTKISTPDSETHESPIDQSESADYTSNRRLTRHQLAVMEKMDELRNTVSTTLPINEAEIKTTKRSKRTRSKAKQEDNAAHSDNESIASTGSSVVSRASSLRSRGSRTSQSKSNAKGKKEKKSSESTPPIDKPLATIDEDSENDDSAFGPRLRGRPAQTKK